MRAVKFLLTASTVAALAACATDVSVENLQGTWDATTYIYANQANASQQVDLIASQGASATLTVEATGTTTWSFDNGQGSTSTDGGAFTADGKMLTLGGVAYQASVDGNRLTLVYGGAQWDFDSDGTMEAATLTITLQRR